MYDDGLGIMYSHDNSIYSTKVWNKLSVYISWFDFVVNIPSACLKILEASGFSSKIIWDASIKEINIFLSSVWN